MRKYLKVNWPESQLFQTDEYEDICYWCDDMICFVPEALYSEVMRDSGKLFEESQLDNED